MKAVFERQQRLTEVLGVIGLGVVAGEPVLPLGALHPVAGVVEERAPVGTNTAPEMVGMTVRDDHRVDRVGIDPPLLENRLQTVWLFPGSGRIDQNTIRAGVDEQGANLEDEALGVELVPLERLGERIGRSISEQCVGVHLEAADVQIPAAVGAQCEARHRKIL
ncbi:MAG TPA: hypothetical protein VIJ84_07000 [Gaiellaceae bacterium]